MRKVKFLIPKLLLIFSLLSCQSKENKLYLNNVSIDTTHSKEGELILPALPTVTEKLKLQSLTKGVDSFEFRFWLPKSIGDTINVLSIKYYNKEWISDLISFNPKYTTNDRFEKFKQIEIENYKHYIINPDLLINQVIDSLSILDLQNAPPNSEIEKSDTGAQIRYILEFADKKNYRVIHYFNPKHNPKNIEFDKKFKLFLQLIRRHYKIDI